MNTGVPDTPLLEELGDRAKVTDLTTDVMAEFDQLDKNPSCSVTSVFPLGSNLGSPLNCSPPNKDRLGAQEFLV